MADAIILRFSHPAFPPGRVQGFSLIWAFYVKGFIPETHCQCCFKGLRAPNFHSRNASSGVDIILDLLDVSPIVYICGVAMGPEDQRKYRNLHLPVRYEEGSTTSATTYNGYTVEVTNARALPIPPVPDGYNGLPPHHTRCKNFQFGLATFGTRQSAPRA
ncbi:hypothetical protein TBR22_A28650 [Luteitalea sp. TBR-22]|uniref:hypothetical protein n=1 Tax=Luteitalea sp. TBR-22 TaxID=2802971 RepID=UPI001AF989EF|nr:hypothetical protein [Luteitalea sp. TBR-22]BCS33638.1 hypothetical protein TBR22_A28650 [Luteitalea sp. TBR-22]